MKYILVLVMILTTLLNADNLDLTKSEGVNQTIISSLTPKPSDIEVDSNTTIKATFKEPLNERFLKRAVTLKKLNSEDKTKSFFGFRFGFGKRSQDENIRGEINYDKQTNTLTFQPKEPLKVGYYEIRYKHLMKKISPKKMMRRDIRIKDISYRFYVPEVVNGYKLPPKPDPKINNATLLGIDSNNNGVRDDVERFIIAQYKDKHKAVTEIGFQIARAFQEAIRRNSNALPTDTYLDDAQDCMLYFKNAAEEFGDKKLIDHTLSNDFENLILNTKSRVKAYLEYDRQFSGGSYRLTPNSKKKSKCSKEVLDLVGGVK